jgi:hypothetical protein
VSDPPPPSSPEPEPTGQRTNLPPAPQDAGGEFEPALPRVTKGPIAILIGAVVAVAIVVGVLALARSRSNSAGSPSAAPTVSNGAPVGGQTFADHGVTFQFPSGWIHGQSILSNQVGTSLWSETFAPKPLDPNGVVVTQYRLTQDLSSLPPSALETQLKQLVAQSLGGQNVSDVTQTTVGSMAAYQVTFDAEANNVEYAVELTMIFDGLDQYNINCQSSSTATADIGPGCQQIKRTFQLASSPSATP